MLALGPLGTLVAVLSGSSLTLHSARLTIGSAGGVLDGSPGCSAPLTRRAFARFLDTARGLQMDRATWPSMGCDRTVEELPLRRLAWPLPRVSIAACVTAVTVSAALGPSDPATASALHGGHRDSRIPETARASLLALAQSSARRNGESAPRDIQVVQTTAREASRIAGEGNEFLGPGAGLPVYLIAMRGRFICGTCSHPRGARAPHGSVMTLQLPAKAGEHLGTGFGLGNRYPNLAAAGTPVRLRGRSVSSNSRQALSKDACNEPLLPGEPSPPCARRLPGGRQRPQLYVNNRRKRSVLLWALAGIEETGGPAVKVTVRYAILLDGRLIAERSTTLGGAQRVRAEIDAHVRMPAGRHIVGFEALGARFSSREPGEVIVAPVSLVALLLP